MDFQGPMDFFVGDGSLDESVDTFLSHDDAGGGVNTCGGMTYAIFFLLDMLCVLHVKGIKIFGYIIRFFILGDREYPCKSS